MSRLVRATAALTPLALLVQAIVPLDESASLLLGATPERAQLTVLSSIHQGNVREQATVSMRNTKTERMLLLLLLLLFFCLSSTWQARLRYSSCSARRMRTLSSICLAPCETSVRFELDFCKTTHARRTLRHLVLFCFAVFDSINCKVCTNQRSIAAH